MAKTETTLKLEKMLIDLINDKNLFGCLEVTIGWFGKERVDSLAYSTTDVFYSFEVKQSKQDFYSKCHNSFISNKNYYVMPRELYEKVKQDIPSYVGVYVEGDKKWNSGTLICIKQCQKQELKIDKDILKNSLIRSLHRDARKYMQYADDKKFVEENKTKIKRVKYLEKENKDLREEYWYVRQKLNALSKRI